MWKICNGLISKFAPFALSPPFSATHKFTHTYSHTFCLLLQSRSTVFTVFPNIKCFMWIIYPDITLPCVLNCIGVAWHSDVWKGALMEKFWYEKKWEKRKSCGDCGRKRFRGKGDFDIKLANLKHWNWRSLWPGNSITSKAVIIGAHCIRNHPWYCYNQLMKMTTSK